MKDLLQSINTHRYDFKRFKFFLFHLYSLYVPALKKESDQQRDSGKNTTKNKPKHKSALCVRRSSSDLLKWFPPCSQVLSFYLRKWLQRTWFLQCTCHVTCLWSMMNYILRAPFHLLSAVWHYNRINYPPLFPRILSPSFLLISQKQISHLCVSPTHAHTHTQSMTKHLGTTGKSPAVLNGANFVQLPPQMCPGGFSGAPLTLLSKPPRSKEVPQLTKFGLSQYGSFSWKWFSFNQ